MSWNVTVGGDAEKVKRQTAESIKAQSQYTPNSTLEKIGEVAAQLAAVYPDKVIAFETSGHLDAQGGSLTVTARVFRE